MDSHCVKSTTKYRRHFNDYYGDCSIALACYNIALESASNSKYLPFKLRQVIVENMLYLQPL